VTVREVNTGKRYVEEYDKLIVSTGASPVKPNIKGVDDERVFTLRNIPDMDRIKAAVAREGVTSAVVVGAGFIGLEMAENLKKAGLSVTVIEQLNQVMNTVDYPMAAMVHRHLRSRGVHLLLGETVTAFERKATAYGYIPRVRRPSIRIW
jgi:NADPH-dependent 2,4-dienoyl-CoA reductase/sulfur reductase-like enzyme